MRNTNHRKREILLKLDSSLLHIFSNSTQGRELIVTTLQETWKTDSNDFLEKCLDIDYFVRPNFLDSLQAFNRFKK